MIHKYRLTKFDVAERQLHQAIRLFFNRGDPVSIHTLSEAAAQILYDTKDEHGGKSMFRESDLIKPEYQRDWIKHLHKSKNFFKHADWDANSVHEFNEQTNHFSLLDAMNMYNAAKRMWTPETLFYFSWFAIKYPDFLIEHKDDGKKDVVYELAHSKTFDPEDYEMVAEALDLVRSGRQAMEGVTLEMGLPARE